jgi:glutamate transport system permease protein
VQIVLDNLPRLLRGLGVTLQLTLGGFVIGLLIGTVIAVFRVSPIKPLRILGAGYVAAMVNSPLIFLVFLAFYGVPKLGALLSNFQCALIAVGLYIGGYVAEAVRSGFNAVSNGQAEAARAIGLTFGQTLTHVILPQALRSSVGPLAVLLNANYRNVAVAGAIGVAEVVKAGSDLSDETAQLARQPRCDQAIGSRRVFPLVMVARCQARACRRTANH